SKQGYRVTEITGILATDPELVARLRRLGDRRILLGYQPADFRWRQLTDLFPGSHMPLLSFLTTALQCPGGILLSPPLQRYASKGHEDTRSGQNGSAYRP